MTKKYYLLDVDGFHNGNIADTDQGGDWVLLDECPDDCYFWNGTAWIISEEKHLCTCKITKKQDIEDKWQSYIDAHFEEDENLFYCDNNSLSLISASALVCLLKTNVATADRTFCDINKNPITFADKDSFELFCRKIAGHRDRLDKNKLSLKKQAEDAVNTTELEAIDINSGWL